MGLLDDPNVRANLALGAGLLGGGNFGQAASRGLLGYEQSMGQSQEMDQRRMQLDLQRKHQQDAKAQQALYAQFQGADGGAYDYHGLSNAMAAIDPMKALALQQSLGKESAINKLDPKDYTPDSLAKFAQTRNYGDLTPRDKSENWNGLVVNPFDVKPGQFVPDANKPFNISDGKIVPNVAYQNYEMGRAKAGATNVSTKIENKMGEGIAAQVGPMLRESYTAANGAAQQVDAANRLIKAVDSGKVISGPLAGARLSLAQIGQTLGVGGKDEAEKIANTRAAIRGLSELTLQGRKQMTGQGAITESEGKLAEKANSGDIQELTGAELKQLAKASARAAQFVYGQHQNMVGNLNENPSTAGLAKFYRPLPMPDIAVDAAPQVFNVDNLVDKYRTK